MHAIINPNPELIWSPPLPPPNAFPYNIKEGEREEDMEKGCLCDKKFEHRSSVCLFLTRLSSPFLIVVCKVRESYFLVPFPDVLNNAFFFVRFFPPFFFVVRSVLVQITSVPQSASCSCWYWFRLLLQTRHRPPPLPHRHPFAPL